MRLLTHLKTLGLPLALTSAEVLEFNRAWPDAHRFILVMATGWRTNPEPGEEDWFEELTPDELDDEDFVEDFKEATIQLWLK